MNQSPYFQKQYPIYANTISEINEELQSYSPNENLFLRDGVTNNTHIVFSIHDAEIDEAVGIAVVSDIDPDNEDRIRTKLKCVYTLFELPTANKFQYRVYQRVAIWQYTDVVINAMDKDEADAIIKSAVNPKDPNYSCAYTALTDKKFKGIITDIDNDYLIASDVPLHGEFGGEPTVTIEYTDDGYSYTDLEM